MIGDFLSVSSDTLYYTQAQTFFLNHLIMNSVMSDILWLKFFLIVSSDTLYYTQAKTLWFESFDHEFIHVWQHIAGVF